MQDFPSPVFLDVKNWEKFQPPTKVKQRSWIRVDTNLEDDVEFQRLTMFKRALLVDIWRLRGRTGKPVCADPVYVGRAICASPKERHYLPGAISELILSGFLFLCNQQGEPIRDETRRDETDVSAVKTQRKQRVGKTPKKQLEFSPDNGHPKQGDYVKAAEEVFKLKYAQKPYWQTNDFVNLANILHRKPELTVAEFSRLYKVFLSHPDVFHQKQGGSLKYFCSNFDKFLEPITSERTDEMIEYPLLKVEK